MELTKIYTTILHDPSEGHVVHYVQLPFGMHAAQMCAQQLVEDHRLGHDPDSKVIAIIPGRHTVGFGEPTNTREHTSPTWIL